MSWQIGLTAAALFTALLVTAILLINTWSNRRAPGAMAYLALMLLNIGWLLSSALTWHAGDENTSYFFFRVSMFFVVLVPVSFFIFSLHFTRMYRYLTRGTITILLAIPVLTQIIVWTNHLHHLAWSDVRVVQAGAFTLIDPATGAWTWIQTVYSYLLVVLGAAVLITNALRQKHQSRKMILLVVSSVLIPLGLNSLSILGVAEGFTLNFTPYLFALTSPAVVYGLMRFRVFDLIPIQRETLIDGLSDSIIVVDRLERIIDINPAACKILNLEPEATIGMDITKAVPELEPWLHQGDLQTWQHPLIDLGINEAIRHYALRITTLRHKSGAILGRMIVLRDVTRLKRSEMSEREARRTAEARSTELETLNRFANTLNQASTLKEAASTGLPILLSYLDAECSWLALSRNLEAPILAAVQTRHGALDPDSFDPELIRDCPPKRQLEGNRNPVIHVTECPLAESLTGKTMSEFHHLCIPLHVGNRLLGSLHLLTAETASIEVNRSEFYAAVAQQLSAAIERTSLFEEIQQLAITDPLTGLFNRRHFDYLAERELRRAQRMKRTLAIIMMDLDHFKKVNDLYGHLTGDRVLKGIAERCKNTLRELDILARYGGEEFVILLPECDFERALQVAERLRTTISDKPFTTERDLIWVTASLGVSALPAGSEKTLMELVREADLSLYHAKSAGRNKVHS